MFGAKSLLTKSPSQPASFAKSRFGGAMTCGARQVRHLFAQPRSSSTGLLLGARRIRCEKQWKYCGPAEPDQIVNQHGLPAFRSRRDARYRFSSRRIGAENT
jgi:hypothetical protein